MPNKTNAQKHNNVQVEPQAEVNLAQLAAAITQLQQQLQEVNRRLDMVYGAVNRLADTKPDSRPAAEATTRQENSRAVTPAPSPSAALNLAQMMDPGSMLDSLRQHAVDAGLDVSADMVHRLKTGLPQGE